jgi:hypothetical protein
MVSGSYRPFAWGPPSDYTKNIVLEMFLVSTPATYKKSEHLVEGADNRKILRLRDDNPKAIINSAKSVPHIRTVPTGHLKQSTLIFDKRSL